MFTNTFVYTSHQQNEGLVWIGSTNETILQVSGKKCHCVQPDIKNIDGISTYVFDKSFIYDIGALVKLAQCTTVEKVTKKKETELFRKCFICEKNTSLNKMRCHVGKHILLNQIGTDVPCGYCGRSVCNNKLVVSSKTKGKKNYRPESTCPYFVDVFRKPTKSSKTTPCLNFLEKCNVCNENVWKYNRPKHFELMHDSHDVPTIPDDEKNNVILYG